MSSTTPVLIAMGSKSDWPTMKLASDLLNQLEIGHRAQIISAHRTPLKMVDFAQTAREMGAKIIIAGAGGAAHLPGMLSSLTSLPVIGVPIKSSALNGIDSLLSICQMPKGVPVATMSIGDSGAVNAALMAASILALSDPDIQQSYQTYRQQQSDAVLAEPMLVE